MSRSRTQKIVLVFAVILLVSFGLCGINFAAYNVVGANFEGPTVGAHGHLKDSIAGFLTLTGALEVAGMLVGVLGLVIALLAWLTSAVINRNRKDRNP